jgi:DNA-binding CsgD family transcriptional regulator
MPGPVRPSRLRVLVLAEDGPMRRALARHFITSSLDVELVESFKEIESRTIGDHAAPELIVLLPSPRGTFGASGVAALVVRASSLIPRPPSPPSDDGHGATLASLVSTYALQRAFSPQQVKVLRLYLTGKNDKEIAELCACSPATIYEHWQRMAKKGGAQHKADVIADFHRFLGNG